MNLYINTNTTVRVQLTEFGKQIYRNHYENFPALMRLDKNGIIEATLWEVMHIFGEHCYVGAEVAFVNNDLIFDLNR